MSHIYIPSRKRSNDIKTLAYISPKWRERVTFVVHKDERMNYVNKVPRVITHEHDNMGDIRRFIGEQAMLDGWQNFIMLDDDFRLYRRANEESTSLVKQTHDDFDRMMDLWLDALNHHPCVGICFRSGNNHYGPVTVAQLELNTRQHGAMGFQTEYYRKIPRFDLKYMEDFAMILWGLANGYTNAKFLYWVYDQNMTGAKGGCSDTRDHAAQEEAAKQLFELFPKYVTLVQKENKTGGAFGQRTDVRIAWAKAAADGAKLKS